MSKEINITYLKNNYHHVVINYGIDNYIRIPVSCFKKFKLNIYELNWEHYSSFMEMEIENNNNIWCFKNGNVDKKVSPIDKLLKNNYIQFIQLEGLNYIKIHIDWVYDEDCCNNLAFSSKLIDYKTVAISSDVNNYYINKKKELEEEIKKLNSQLEYCDKILVEKGLLSKHDCDLPSNSFRIE